VEDGWRLADDWRMVGEQWGDGWRTGGAPPPRSGVPSGTPEPSRFFFFSGGGAPELSGKGSTASRTPGDTFHPEKIPNALDSLISWISPF